VVNKGFAYLLYREKRLFYAACGNCDMFIGSFLEARDRDDKDDRLGFDAVRDFMLAFFGK
jgi:hypothetical protein